MILTMNRFTSSALIVVALSVALSGCEDLISGTSSCGSMPKIASGEGVSWKCISASEGGSLPVPGDPDSSLTIPPGALSSNTMIVIRAVARPRSGYLAVRLEPDGLQLNKPAILKIGTDSKTGNQPLIRAFHGSSLNPQLNAGSELTDWERANVTAVDTAARNFQISLEHFSFVYAMFGIQDVGYLVLDIPDKYMRPGDIMVALTNTQPKIYGPDWRPGHVGMFRGILPDGRGTVYESTPPRVQTAAAARFRTGFGHIYLGARRPPGGHLKEAERPQIINFLSSKLSLPYSLVGDGADGTYSCVGLVEKALDSIGRGALDLLNEQFYSTPYEMYAGTSPVEKITIDYGDTIEMPVYSVSAVAGGSHLTPFIDSWYGKGTTKVTAKDLPKGATFTGPPAGSGIAGIYTFKWTPTLEQIGQDHTILFNASGGATIGIGLHTYDVSGLITIHVSGYQHDFVVNSAVSSNEIGGLYGDSVTIDANATIRGTHFIDLATGAAPSSTPFPEHQLTILAEGELSTKPLKYGISFRVSNTTKPPTVFKQPPLKWRYIVDYTEPLYAGK
jgi:hypothetical protein